MKFGRSTRVFALATLLLMPTAAFSMEPLTLTVLTGISLVGGTIKINKSELATKVKHYFFPPVTTKSGFDEADTKRTVEKSTPKSQTTQASVSTSNQELRQLVEKTQETLASMSRMQERIKVLQDLVAVSNKEQEQEKKRVSEYATLEQITQMRTEFSAELSAAKKDFIAQIKECATKQELLNAQTTSLKTASEHFEKHKQQILTEVQSNVRQSLDDHKALTIKECQLTLAAQSEKAVLSAEKAVSAYGSALDKKITAAIASSSNMRHEIIQIQKDCGDLRENQTKQAVMISYIESNLVKKGSIVIPPSTASALSDSTITLPAHSTSSESAFISDTTSVVNSPFVAEDNLTASAVTD